MRWNLIIGGTYVFIMAVIGVLAAAFIPLFCSLLGVEMREGYIPGVIAIATLFIGKVVFWRLLSK